MRFLRECEALVGTQAKAKPQLNWLRGG